MFDSSWPWNNAFVFYLKDQLAYICTLVWEVSNTFSSLLTAKHCHCLHHFLLSSCKAFSLFCLIIISLFRIFLCCAYCMLDMVRAGTANYTQQNFVAHKLDHTAVSCWFQFFSQDSFVVQILINIIEISHWIGKLSVSSSSLCAVPARTMDFLPPTAEYGR